jgi:uncharacterized protein (DUF1778 family)
LAYWRGGGFVKTNTIEMRVSNDEKEAFRKAADISGLTLSAWIRERLRKAAVSELEHAGVPIPFYRVTIGG